MPAITALSDKKILIIDDLPGMRSQLRASLSTLGFERLNLASNIREAMVRLSELPYDIILCDYYLGDATSGQQFLEYVRTKGLISPSAIFIMITAERTYETVMRAAEWTPDDYLVKPFTAAHLEARLTKLIEKRERFAGVYAAIEKENLRQAVAACGGIIESKDKFFIDAMKLKGQLLLRNGDYSEAQALYRDVLDLRPVGWAQLGLARALKAQNAVSEAQTMLESLIAENRHMMGAYDTLAEVLSVTDREEQALSVLKSAMEVSPGTLSRTRTLGKLAIATGEMEVAEKTVRQLLTQHKHSPVKEAGDYLMAANVLSTTGRPDEALSLVKEAKAAFANTADVHTLAVAEATAHLALGSTEAAAAALKKVQDASPNSMDPETAAALGKALYTVGDHEGGQKVLRHLVQNNPDDAKILQAVRATLSAVGKEHEAEALVDSSIQEIIKENNEGVKLAYAGQLDEAIGKLVSAAERLPGNLQIVSNAALVLALSIGKAATSKERLQNCLKYRKMVVARDPRHPKLAQIDALLIQTKGAQP